MLWAGFEMEKLAKRNVISSCSETEIELFNLKVVGIITIHF